MTIWWYVYFYGSYLINWTFNPFMMGYTDSGSFTIKGKSWDSIRYNFPWYMLYLGFFLVFCGFMYLTAWGRQLTDNGGGVLGVLIGLNLAFGLLWLALIVGYGMVKIPIACWKNSDMESRLDYFCHKVAHYDDQIIKVVSENR
jgi:hypothetical protein